MNITNKDLNLLLVLHVVYQERSASQAAIRLNLSQPALSHKLNKLRHEFADPLFVRAPRGLTPTPRAHALAPHVQKLVGALECFYEQCDGRDFLSRAERIHLYTTDYMEQTLLPRLIPLLRHQAPELVLVSHNTRGRLPREELEKGTCDLAIAGFFTDLPDTLHQQRLFTEDYVVLADRDNPLLAAGMTLESFLACEHLLTTLSGDLDGVVDRALAALGRQRRLAGALSSFIAPTRLVAGSRLLLTCLRSIAEEACECRPQLVMHPLPFAMAPVEIMQIWHERTDADPLRRWVRQQISSLTSAGKRTS